jgi:hypothetical protein
VPSAAANRDLARRQARQLLSLAPVPGGAVRLGSAPRSLPDPAMGEPEVSSLVDQTRSWQIPMPFGQAVAWIEAHRPRGLHRDGSTSGWDQDGTTTTGYGYGGPASPAWQSAELDVEVAPASHGQSVLRADGLVVWLDPVPLRDTAPGPRLRVTAARGCPASDARFRTVTNSGTGLARRLLPPGDPNAGLECRYHGANGPAWRLRRVTRLSARAARRLAASMSRLPLGHTEGGVVSCPMDDGSAEVIALSYPHAADLDLWVNLNGCGGVSNGFIIVG